MSLFGRGKKGRKKGEASNPYLHFCSFRDVRRFQGIRFRIARSGRKVKVCVSYCTASLALAVQSSCVACFVVAVVSFVLCVPQRRERGAAQGGKTKEGGGAYKHGTHNTTGTQTSSITPYIHKLFERDV
jgi:hypothetical protein